VAVTRKLRAPRKRPIAWRRWAVRGGIAAAILITAASAVMVESRSDGLTEIRGASAPAPRVAPTADPRQPQLPTPPLTATTQTPIAGTATYSNESGVIVAPTRTDSAAARARRDSVRRANTARLNAGLTRSDTGERRPATEATTRRQTRRDDQDLMMLSDSLAGGSDQSSGSGQQEPNTPPR
jgi:hypothetical protein